MLDFAPRFAPRFHHAFAPRPFRPVPAASRVAAPPAPPSRLRPGAHGGVGQRGHPTPSRRRPGGGRYAGAPVRGGGSDLRRALPRAPPAGTGDRLPDRMPSGAGARRLGPALDSEPRL